MKKKGSMVSLGSLGSLPEEGAAWVPKATMEPRIRCPTESQTAAAVDKVVHHAVHFQDVVQSTLRILEEQMINEFTRALVDVLRQNEGICGRCSRHAEPDITGPEDLASMDEGMALGGGGGAEISACCVARLPYVSKQSQPSPKMRMEQPNLAEGISRPVEGSASARLQNEGGGVTVHMSPQGSSQRLSAQSSSNAPARERRTSISSIVSDIKPEQMESVASWILERQSKQSPCAEMMWRFLEDPESGIMAYWFNKLMPAFIFLSVFITLLQTVEWTPLLGSTAAALEFGIEAFFALEVIVRFAVYPNKWHFPLDPYNLIDFFAAVPLAFRCVASFEVSVTFDREDWLSAFLLCFVPVIRLLKILRRYRQFHLLLKAFRLAGEALPVLLFCYFVGLLLFAALIYTCERPNNIESLSQAMWLTVVTMTTLGYGDLTPQTSAGKVVVSILTVCSTLYMAVPLGIIGNCFHEVWSDRDRILLMQILKRRLRQWGYTAADIPTLFQDFDMDGDGMLDFEEFRRMVTKLRLGLSQERVVELFETFDEDHGGSIDDKEFVRATFPAAYHQIYNLSSSGSRQTLAASIVQLVRKSSRGMRVEDTMNSEMSSMGHSLTPPVGLSTSFAALSSGEGGDNDADPFGRDLFSQISNNSKDEGSIATTGSKEPAPF